MPADIKCKCPHCAAPLRVGEQFSGKTVPCPKCQGRLVIPQPLKRVNSLPIQPLEVTPAPTSLAPDAPSTSQPPLVHVKSAKSATPSAVKPHSRILPAIPTTSINPSAKILAETANAFNLESSAVTTNRKTENDSINRYCSICRKVTIHERHFGPLWTAMFGRTGFNVEGSGCLCWAIAIPIIISTAGIARPIPRAA